MKKYLLFLMILIFTIPLIAQETTIYNAATKTTLDNYLTSPSTELEGNRIRVLLHFDFGKSTIINIADLRMLQLCKIEKVNLFYSDFPASNNFKSLNLNRLKALIDMVGIKEFNGTEWSIIKQTECTNLSEALQLFHGFEIIVEYPESFNITNLEIDSSFNDFVVQRVFDRNQWTEMLVTTDLTGSMYPYAVQLFIWMKLNTIDDRVKQFVFFNDGDTTPDKFKKIGATGGVYQTRAKSYNEVERVATQCMISGNGGDLPENDIEALLKGIKLCQDCKENILIVDNHSNIRDIDLISKINKPVRVIICGGLSEINPEYLNLARKTGGSIHLMEEDITNLMEINEGETISINGVEYEVKKDEFKKVIRM